MQPETRVSYAFGTVGDGHGAHVRARERSGVGW